MATLGDLPFCVRGLLTAPSQEPTANLSYQAHTQQQSTRAWDVLPAPRPLSKH